MVIKKYQLFSNGGVETYLAYAFYQTPEEAQKDIDEFEEKTYAVNGGNWIVVPEFELFKVYVLPPDDRKNKELAFKNMSTLIEVMLARDRKWESNPKISPNLLQHS
jgi:hypothetical protein